MRRLTAAAVLTALLTAACGSTVQVKGTATVGDGLGSSPQAGLTTGGTSGAVTTGSTGAVAGSTGAVQGGTGGPGPSGTSGQVGVPGSATATTGGAASTSGVTTGNHDPIQIGFVTTSVGNAAALGVNAGQTYTDRAMFDALVAEYNAQGGVAGHKIVPVYGDTDTASSNWSNQFAAVCAKFTQDNHVKAVIGYVFVFLPSFESCLAKAQVPHLYGGYQPGDVVDQRSYPTIIGTGHPTVDGFDLTALDGALRTGLLNAKTKLGLIVDTCADGDRAYNSSVVPWLKAHKVDYQTVTGNCAQGASDVSGAASAISNAELRFASSGVNLVFASAVELLVFMEDAQSQGYQPEYLTAVGGAALEANAPASQMKHLHGFGWMPSVDVNPSHQPYPQTPTQKACIAKLVRHGLKPAAYNDFMAAYQACDGIDLYAKALASTGTTQPRAITAAVGRAMATYPAAGTYGGGLRAVDHQRGGPSTYRAYAWTDSCSCVTYRGPTYPIPTP
jgi:ABC-type branched-subunit amino acid transport system substrate-binding protein